MPSSRQSRVRAVWLIGMAMLLLVAVATIAACGGSDYEGTWLPSGQEGAMVIKKAGDGYDVTIKAKESDASGITLKATKDGDSLKIKDPSGKSQEVITLTISGDKMTMKSGSQTETLTRKK
jgi:hypothetical protein